MKNWTQKAEQIVRGIWGLGKEWITPEIKNTPLSHFHKDVARSIAKALSQAYQEGQKNPNVDLVTVLAYEAGMEEGREKAIEACAVEAEHQDRFGQNHLTIAAAIRKLKKG